MLHVLEAQLDNCPRTISQDYAGADRSVMEYLAVYTVQLFLLTQGTRSAHQSICDATRSRRCDPKLLGLGPVSGLAPNQAAASCDIYGG